MTPTPTRPSSSYEITEESVTVKIYRASCSSCGRRFRHRDRRTLEHNLDEHYQQWHSVEAGKRQQREKILKEIGRVRKHLNRISGR